MNKSQKEAVDSIEGPVMLIAGPGTGKTTVLVMRIANIISKTDTDPSNILALTYTESGVISMIKALAAIIGPDAHRVKISTFHGFCNSLINEFPEEFSNIVGARHIPESEQIDLVEKILTEEGFDVLTPFGSTFLYVRDLLSSVSGLKREGVNPETFIKEATQQEKDFLEREDLYHEKGRYAGKMKGEHIKTSKHIEKNKEFGRFYDVYQRRLREALCYDYDDMILEVVSKLESDEDFSVLIQEDNHYILADEHQDANSSQNRVIKELTSFHQNPNLFIVGDEKQAIFRFQGASLDNFLYFKKLHPDIKIIHLNENYRSQQTVLDVSHKLIEAGSSFDAEVHKPLVAMSEREKQSVTVFESETIFDESLTVAMKIRELLNEDVSPEEIAVIYRNHKDAKSFVRALEKMKIPFALRSDKNLFDDVFIRNFILLISAVCDPVDDDKLFNGLLANFLQIDPVDVYKVSRFAKYNRSALVSVLENDNLLKKAEVSDIDNVKKVYGLIKKWNRQGLDRNLLNTLESIAYESGAVDVILESENSAGVLNRFRSFFKHADRFASEVKNARLLDFDRHLSVIDSYALSLRGSEGSFVGRVELLTAHASKGREFDYVFIVNVTDKKWGNRRPMGKFKFPEAFKGIFESGDNEDERRLFYVSLTRARLGVFVSWSRFAEDDKEKLPSVFVADIEEKGLTITQHSSAIEKIDEKEKNKLFFSPGERIGLSLKEKDYVIKAFLENPLSVTALNNYIECPWAYFYRNLVRIPGVYSLPQRFGTATHEALRDFFVRLRDEGNLGKEYLLERFYLSLSKQPILENEEKELREKGEKVLSGYYDAYDGSWRSDVEVEKKIKGVSLEFDFLPSPLLLTGNIDKIEGKGDLTVVDYKTARPKSRNEIEGKTKNSKGNYKRQLVFYKLIVDASKEIEGSVSDGVMDFIEPNNIGKYKREVFSITEDDVKNLKIEIEKMAEEIHSLSFLDEKCEKSDCEFCQMRENFTF